MALNPGEKVKVKIDKLGRPTIEAEGFIGGACKIATKPIEDAFAGGGGKDVVIDKPELHMLGGNENEQHLHN